MLRGWVRWLYLSGLLLLVSGVFLNGSNAQADASEALTWGNTVAAAAETYTAPEGQAGKMLLGLLVVLGLMAGLAWWVARLRRQAPALATTEPTHVLVCNRFNSQQTFMVWEEQGKIMAGIFKKQALEMWIEIPGVGLQRNTPLQGGKRESPKTFQDIWWGLLKSQKRG